MQGTIHLKPRSATINRMSHTPPNLLINYHDALIYESDLEILDHPTAWLNSDCIHFQLTRLSTLQKERCLQHEQDEGEQVDDLFLDPAVVSFLMHQCDEEDNDELLDLNTAWNLTIQPQPSASLQSNIQTKRVFVPINDQYARSRSAFATPGGGSHWSFLLWVLVTSSHKSSSDLDAVKFSSKYYHFDSSRGYNASAAEAVSNKLQKVLFSSNNCEDDMEKEYTLVECQTPQQTNGYDCGVFMLGVADALSSCGFDAVKADYEAKIQSVFENMGGNVNFAQRLRRQIGDDIRMLAKREGK